MSDAFGTMPSMAEPRVVPRAEHSLSRRDIDPDALKVLYRLRQFDHIAYLVGGSVRDLLLGRRPKDFDIGTSAHPYQVKKLFRNCWIIGRRFRLAHVKFGNKVIEVATFRRQVAAGEEVGPDGVPAPIHQPPAEDSAAAPATNDRPLIHHDNTFGTPEEDAFRRDFTINALFYDIATFSIIDYVGGLEICAPASCDRSAIRKSAFSRIRCGCCARWRSRRGWISRSIRRSSTRSSGIGTKSRAARRRGCSRSTTRFCARGRRSRRFAAWPVPACSSRSPPNCTAARRCRCGSRSPRLDAYRRRFESTPETLTNAILLGSLLVPLGVLGHPARHASTSAERTTGRQRTPGLRLGELPLARRDVERLRQILGAAATPAGSRREPAEHSARWRIAAFFAKP